MKHAIDWNSNGLSLLELHERETIDRGGELQCSIGSIAIDQDGAAWLSNWRGESFLVGSGAAPAAPAKSTKRLRKRK